MRRFVALLLFSATLLATLATGPRALAHSPYRVEVEGVTALDGTHLYLRDGQLMASAGPLAAALGLQVRWNDTDRRLDLSGRGHWAVFWLGSRTVYRDDVHYLAPAPTSLHDGLVYVPVWFTAQLFGYHVTWDGSVMRLTRKDGTGSAAPGDPLRHPNFVFPFPAGVRYEPYTDNYGEGRSWSPGGTAVRGHEGIDILAPKGTPLVAVADGTVVRVGWNEYGGWRLQIRPDVAPEYRIYYAHLNGYGANLYEGARVRAGQVVGYVGRTGYGPPGTEGDFPPHLHLGIYRADGSTINPYPYLKEWERRPLARLW